MKYQIILILLFSGLTAMAQNKSVCLSFDDLPVVSYGIEDTVFQNHLMDNLIASLKNNRIPAIGFVNEKKLYSHDTLNPFKLELLKKWIDHDLDLGNHTYSHPDYNTVSVDHYTRDILKGETISKKLLADKHKPLRYFRHPFLHVGQTKEKADSLKAFLAQANYTVAPVTIDNEDYLFAVAYHRARVKNDTSLMLQIGHDFIDYLEKKIIYYEKYPIFLFGRPISQIFLLHASLLNSIYTDSLTIMLKKNHYDFISMDDALKDSAYQTEITVYSDWGISWIDRWALSQGKKGDFFKDDPVTPDYIKELAK